MKDEEKLRGVARHVATHGEGVERILTLRLEQVDHAGSVVGTSQVELGFSERSALPVDGDELEVRGARRPDGVVVAHEIANLSTGVRRRSARGLSWLVPAALLLPVLSGVGGFFMGGAFAGFVSFVLMGIAGAILVVAVSSVMKRR